MLFNIIFRQNGQFPSVSGQQTRNKYKKIGKTGFEIYSKQIFPIYLYYAVLFLTGTVVSTGTAVTAFTTRTTGTLAITTGTLATGSALWRDVAFGLGK